jgi:hypothetical protein
MTHWFSNVFSFLCARRLLCVLLVGAFVTFAFPIGASAHLYDSDGLWTFRYFTRHQAAKPYNPYWCYSEDSAYWEDPLNVIFFAYGEGYRIGSHVRNDNTGYNGTSGSSQVICGNGPGSSRYDYSYSMLWEIDQLGKPSCTFCTRWHLRLWVAPHGHDDHYNKWSTTDAHHEYWNGSTHVIDRAWEDAEWDIGAALSGPHYFAYDYWYRRGGTVWKNHWDDGVTTRVGGEHYNQYP